MSEENDPASTKRQAWPPPNLANQRMVLVRREIKAFAFQMEMEMRRHDPKKGDSWKTMNLGELRTLFSKSHRNWLWSLTDNERHQLIDIANLAMMLWHRMEE